MSFSPTNSLCLQKYEMVETLSSPLKIKTKTLNFQEKKILKI